MSRPRPRSSYSQFRRMSSLSVLEAPPPNLSDCQISKETRQYGLKEDQINEVQQLSQELDNLSRRRNSLVMRSFGQQRGNHSFHYIEGVSEQNSLLELKSELKPKDMSEEVAKTTSLQILNDNKPSLLLQFTKFETIEEAFDVNEEEADQKSKQLFKKCQMKTSQVIPKQKPVTACESKKAITKKPKQMNQLPLEKTQKPDDKKISKPPSDRLNVEKTNTAPIIIEKPKLPIKNLINTKQSVIKEARPSTKRPQLDTHKTKDDMAQKSGLSRTQKIEMTKSFCPTIDMMMPTRMINEREKSQLLQRLNRLQKTISSSEIDGNSLQAIQKAFSELEDLINK